MPAEHPWRLPPYQHQRDAFELTKRLTHFAVFWEMGTGKTKLIIDTAAHLYLEELIQGLLVIAPNSVKKNWTAEEVPTHVPTCVGTHMLCYQSDKAKTKWQQAEVEALMRSQRCLRVLSMGYDSLKTDQGIRLAKRFLKAFPSLVVLDEATAIKNPNAVRSKRVKSLRPLAPFRRILTGTPVAQGPFDVWFPMKWLDENFWEPHGLDSFVTFKTTFARYEPRERADGRQWQQLVCYRDLESLHKIIAPVSSRVLKEDVLDLPPKVYEKRRFTLSSVQRRAYEQMKEEYEYQLQNGQIVEGAMIMTRMLRFQQITCGYLPSYKEDGELEWTPLEDNKNPRLELLLETLEEIPEGGQAIIWARFTEDINLICRALGKTAARYDGETKTDDARTEALDAFRSGRARWLVANPMTVAMGITLTNAHVAIYYSNSFNYPDRLQSEDREHRIGQTSSVTIIDLLAEESIDEHIVKNLVDKNDIARIVTGDRLREWL